MAKSTRAQEISTGTSDSYTETELADPHPPIRIQRAVLGGESPSVGTDFSEPLSNESQSNELGNPSPQEPALTTESLSGQTATEDSTVNLTDGDGPETETVSAEEIPPYSEWTYKELQAEAKERGLMATGSTEELIARLEEFDEAQAEEVESEEDDFA